MADLFTAGDCVEVFGLQSETGKQLNGKVGLITTPLSSSGRFELTLDDKIVSVKLENLRSASSDRFWSGGKAQEERWRPGDQARVVGVLEDAAEAELHKLSSILAKLVGRQPGEAGRWLVEVQGKRHSVKVQHLRVCTQDDEAKWGLESWKLQGRCWLGAVLLATLLLLLETEFCLARFSALRLADAPLVPGPRVAVLAVLVPTCSLLWILGTVGGCYRMHESLMDPMVRFPQISELGVGPASSKTLYRVGFTVAAVLLAATVLLHQELALPHLPGGRQGDLGAAFTWYGLSAAAGVAMQGICLLEPSLSPQTMLHLAGAMVFFYGAWSHMGAAQRLYLPALLPDDAPGWEEASFAVEAAEASILLQHQGVRLLVHFRHSFLMRAPMAFFLLPLAAQFLERAPAAAAAEGATGAASPQARSSMGLVQWLIILNFALIFLSFGPELAFAAGLPLPLEGDSGAEI